MVRKIVQLEDFYASLIELIPKIDQNRTVVLFYNFIIINLRIFFACKQDRAEIISELKELIEKNFIDLKDAKDGIDLK